LDCVPDEDLWPHPPPVDTVVVFVAEAPIGEEAKPDLLESFVLFEVSLDAGLLDPIAVGELIKPILCL
jgi:hypothetical protein